MPKPIENNDNAKQFWGHLADATALEAATKGLLRDVIGAEPVVKSANFSAANGETYHVTATATVTDPASPVEGKGFSVVVLAGTATVGGTAYTAGTVILRSYKSAAWSNDAVILPMASAIAAASSKTTPVDADELGVTDSEASGVLKRLSFANLWAWITGKLNTRYAQLETYFSMLTASGPTCTNSTTLVGTGCTVTLPVGNYLLEAMLFIDSSVSNNGGVKTQLVKSGSGTAAGNAHIGLFTATNATALDSRAAFDFSATHASGAASWVNTLKGHLFVTGDSVVLEWQFALNSTDAALPVRTPIRGTYIRATRIS